MRRMLDGSKFWRSILLVIAFAALAVSAARAARPRITTAGLCGVVTDLEGMPIANATVSAMFADFGTSQQTDDGGRWNFGRGAGPHWMKVEDDGFHTFLFDYVDKENEKSNGADNPAFLQKPKDKSCLTPIYVRLAPVYRKAGMVTLNPSKGVHKEKKSK
jgi:hypothetical protein